MKTKQQKRIEAYERMDAMARAVEMKISTEQLNPTLVNFLRQENNFRKAEMGHLLSKIEKGVPACTRRDGKWVSV